MNAAQVTLNLSSPTETTSSLPAEALSALVDGELGVAEFDRLLVAERDGGTQTLAKWHSYLVIGDALRGAGVVTAAQPPTDFLACIRERIQTEAASDALPVPLVEAPVPAARAVRARDRAANDSVFRWKLVSGVASLAAVTAVGWSVLSVAPSGSLGAAPQMATAPATLQTPAASATNLAAVPPANAVVVSTGQGTLIRDARLEELLAEHRQNAGMSALQMPTGFIRNATYDASGR